jgi:hypothetical protein
MIPPLFQKSTNHIANTPARGTDAMAATKRKASNREILGKFVKRATSGAESSPTQKKLKYIFVSKVKSISILLQRFDSILPII